MDKSSVGTKYIFGPVPSRRLGRSLGVDLVPYKTCTYDCIYCDLGRTTQKTMTRQPYVTSDEIRRELESTLSSLHEKPDYITLSGSGEPTLNQNLGRIIRAVKSLTSIPLAVLTNGSLLFWQDVRDDLCEADVVIPSLDAATPLVFDHVNRPHPLLNLEEILGGLAQFRKEFRNQIWLEVLLCRGVNDDHGEVERIKEAVDRIEPDRLQLNTCVRPPAEEFAFPLTAEELHETAERLGRGTEIISECAASLGDRFDPNIDAEIVELVKRRPCTADDISKALRLHPGAVKKQLASLEKRGVIHFCVYQHACYYEHKRHNRSEGVASR
jgi:wyosine [tRNA(Phe)-imidazoG37] synthetase (radical SAM superfamily)